MKTWCLLLFALAAGLAHAQPQEDTWHVGEVRLSDGSTLTGLFAYDLTYDVVKCQTQPGLRVYPTLHVEEFSFVDSAYYLLRKFYSLPFSVQPNYQRRMFFELLAEGKLSLFAREKKVRIDPMAMDEMIGMPMIVGPVLGPPDAPWRIVYDFYAADSVGNLHALAGNTEEMLLQLMQDHADAMKKYVRDKNPNFKNLRDMVAIVMHYNALDDASPFEDPMASTLGVNK